MRKSLTTAILAASAASLAFAAPAAAQKKGEGGTGVDEDTQLPACDLPFGVASLVEDEAASAGTGRQVDPNLALIARLSGQDGGQVSAVDPLPLLRLMAAKSGCFQVVERGAAQSALERERAMAGIETKQVTADYLITARVVYSDSKSKKSGGGLGGIGRALGGPLGGVLGAGVGFNSKTAEAEVLLALIEVKTGLQVAIASGSARKRDVGLFGGGVLGGMGGLGGTYSSTDIGKVTAIAALDAYIKLVDDARQRIPAPVAYQPRIEPEDVIDAVPTPVTHEN